MKNRKITFDYCKRHHDAVEWNGAVYWTKNWNPWTGCEPVSPACANCYARTIAERFNQKFEPRQTNQNMPPKSGIVFCGNSTDLFGAWVSDRDLFSITDKVFGRAQDVSKDCQYLFLTKRTKRMCDFVLKNKIKDVGVGNVYYGFTAENQDMYNKRLLDTYEMLGSVPMWLSCEPLLGHIDLGFDELIKDFDGVVPFRWVVVGAESGSKRRECGIGWIHSIVSQCQKHNVPVFVKQIHGSDGKLEKDLSAFPKDLQIRQVPWVSNWKGEE